MLADPVAFASVVAGLADPFVESGITHVAGIEARGFILATPVADRLGVGFVPIRKPGKLPFTTSAVSYELEYGTDQLEIHTDAVGPGDRVLLVDDVIATGGTAEAAVALIEGLGATVAGFAVYVELEFLNGSDRLNDLAVTSLVGYA